MDDNAVVSIQRPADSPVVEFGRRELRRFYEPVVFCKVMADISQEHLTLKQPERPLQPKTEEERYRRYLDKLANVCDRKPRGSTVTGLTVIDTESAFLYVFGCNDASGQALTETAKFVAALLRMVSEFHTLDSAQGNAVRSDIFKLIVRFNRPRIVKYVADLQRYVVSCIESCRRKDHDIKPKLKKCLIELHGSIESITLKHLDEADYLESCLKCFSEINAFRKASTGKSIDDVADRGRLHDHKSMSCWSELRHYMTRLIAYERAVTIFVEAEAEWPELFQEFEIWPIVSAPLKEKPLGKKSETANNIIGRMTNDSAEISRYSELADGLRTQPYDLDARIEAKCRQPFRPRVHAEVLVLDWLVRTFETGPSFFQGYKYIGTSKGACKLCNYYFQAHPSLISARPSHGNVYHLWAFPDVRESDGARALGARRKIFNAMNAKIRNDAFKMLEERSATWKRHDSNTYALESHFQGATDAGLGGSDTSEVEELSEQFEADLSFASTSTSPDATGALTDLDDEEGGAALN